jgi:Outer membrane protein
MKQLALIIMLALGTAQLQAQDTTPIVAPAATPALHFGYFSYQGLFESMPDYALAKRNIDDLRIKYDNEMKRVENEFNAKYEQFLEGQRDFAPSILQKRQAELQELMEKNTAFKKEAQRLLQQAEDEAYKPLRTRLDAAIQQVGKDKGLAFILNTDNQAVPYINAATGEDVSAAILAALR